MEFQSFIQDIIPFKLKTEHKKTQSCTLFLMKKIDVVLVLLYDIKQYTDYIM